MFKMKIVKNRNVKQRDSVINIKKKQKETSSSNNLTILNQIKKVRKNNNNILISRKHSTINRKCL